MRCCVGGVMLGWRGSFGVVLVVLSVVHGCVHGIVAVKLLE